MSSTTIVTLLFLSQKLNIYLGIPLILLGVLGGLLSIIVFLSLKTFRQNPCAFYLIIMSVTNIGQLLTGLLTRVYLYETNVNWSLLSEFYCKFRWYLIYVCAMISFTCICLATIDQFLATSSNIQWQRLSNIKSSRCLCFGFILFWILFYIPILIYYRHVISPTTGQVSCTLTNSGYQQFITYGHALILSGFLPIFITILFGLLAFRNIRQIPHRLIPLVRRELDKQLTVMVLVQVIFNFTNVAPSSIMGVYTLAVTTPSDPLNNAVIQLVSTLSIIIYYSYFAVKKFILNIQLKNFCLLSSVHFIFIFVHRNDFVNSYCLYFFGNDAFNNNHINLANP